MNKKNFVLISIVCLILVSFLAASVLAVKLAPGKIGLFGKGKAARALMYYDGPNPDPIHITKANTSDAAVGGENEIWIYPFGYPLYSSGTIDAVAANKLKDSNADFVADGIKYALDHGMTVEARSEADRSKKARVTGVLSSHELSLDSNIFSSVENDPFKDRYAVWVYEVTDDDGLSYHPATVDMYNLDWAIHNYQIGGTVTMKATNKAGVWTPFKFSRTMVTIVAEAGGPESTWYGVTFWRNGALSGEVLTGQVFPQNYDTDLAGTPLMTTIENGFMPLAAWGQNDPSHNYENFKVKNLVLKGAWTVALGIYSENSIPGSIANVECTNLKIVDTTPCPFINPDSNLDVSSLLLGILAHNQGKLLVQGCKVRESDWNNSPAFNNVALANGINFTSPLAVTGARGLTDVTIIGNDVETKSCLLGSGGIVVIGVGSPKDTRVRNVLIEGNHVVSDLAIIANDNLAEVKIINNTSVTARNIGISASDAEDPVPAAWADKARVAIKGNVVALAPGSSSILQPFTAGFCGIDYTPLALAYFPDAQLTSLSNATIQGNTFTGNANFAFFMGDSYNTADYGLPSTAPNQNVGAQNVFKADNNICGLNPIPGDERFAYYYFSQTARHNLIEDLNPCCGNTANCRVVQGHPSNRFLALGNKAGNFSPGWLKTNWINKSVLTEQLKANLAKIRNFLSPKKGPHH